MRIAERRRQAKAFAKRQGKPQNDHQTLTVFFDRERLVGHNFGAANTGQDEIVDTPVMKGEFPDTGQSRMFIWKAMQKARYWFVCLNRSVYGEWRVVNADRC